MIERKVAIELTESEMVLLKDAIVLLEPVHDDESQQEIANDLCADLEVKLEVAINILRT